jgi:hypothetical protein
VGSDDGYDLVLLKETLGQLIAEEVGAAPHVVVLGQLLAVPVLVVHWVRPHQVAEKPTLRHLPETVDLLYVLQLHRKIITVFNSGEMPPWRSRNLRLTRQDKGRQSNMSIVRSYASWLYLLRPKLTT